MYFVLKMGIFHCYVSLPEGTNKTLSRGLVLKPLDQIWMIRRTSTFVINHQLSTYVPWDLKSRYMGDGYPTLW